MSRYLDEFNARLAILLLEDSIRNFFEDTKGNKAYIGISGGKDSSVVAALCVKALGKDRVVGILMPDGDQSDIGDSYDLCKFLDIEYHEVNIHEAMQSIKINASVTNSYENACINLAPRIRMSTLYFMSQSDDMNNRVMNTSNLSESLAGYFTTFGDQCGDFAPILEYTSEEVVLIGRELGLPHHLVEKEPSDGLSGVSDEEKLGFKYSDFNKFIRGYSKDLEELSDDQMYKFMKRLKDTKFKHVINIPSSCSHCSINWKLVGNYI